MATNSTLAEVIHSMRSRGYLTTFTIQRDAIFCPELDTTIAPGSLTLMERHEVKALDKESKREVYGFRTHENVLGIMTDAYADFDHKGFTAVFSQCSQRRQR